MEPKAKRARLDPPPPPLEKRLHRTSEIRALLSAFLAPPGLSDLVLSYNGISAPWTPLCNHKLFQSSRVPATLSEGYEVFSVWTLMYASSLMVVQQCPKVIAIWDLSGAMVSQIKADVAFVSERYHSLFLSSARTGEIKECDLEDLSNPVRTFYVPTSKRIDLSKISSGASDLAGDESGWIFIPSLLESHNDVLFHPDQNSDVISLSARGAGCTRLVRRPGPNMWQTIGVKHQKGELAVGEGTGLVILVHKETGDIRFVTKDTNEGRFVDRADQARILSFNQPVSQIFLHHGERTLFALTPKNRLLPLRF